MRTRKDLHDLIHSLSRSEKRYFKIFASRHVVGKENNYVKLFQAIDNQSEYDEEAIKKKFSGKSFIKHLSAEKRYLTNLVLKSLRAYSESSNTGSYVHALLQDEVTYRAKGLKEPRKRLLTKLLKLTDQFQMFPEQIETLRRMREYTMEFEPRDSLQEIDSIAEQISECEEKHRRELIYEDLYFKMFLLYRASANSRSDQQIKQAEEIVNSSWVREFEQGNSFSAQRRYLGINGVYCRITGDKEGAQRHLNELVNLWEKHPSFIEEHPQDYFLAVDNFLVFSHINGDYSNYETYLEKIRQLSPKNFDEEGEIFQNLACLELFYALNHDDGNGIDDLIQRIEDGLVKYGRKVNEARMLTISINIALARFFEAKYDASLDWLIRIAQLKSQYRQDIQSFARIVELLCHYELGNIGLLTDLTRSTRRTHKRKNRLFEFENQFFRKFNAIVNERNDSRRDGMLHEMLDWLHSPAIQLESGKVTGLNELTRWLELKLDVEPISSNQMAASESAS